MVGDGLQGVEQLLGGSIGDGSEVTSPLEAEVLFAPGASIDASDGDVELPEQEVPAARAAACS